MAGVVRAVIVFVLSNFSLRLLVLGLFVAAVAIARVPRPVSGAIAVEKLLSWYVFFAIGISFF